MLKEYPSVCYRKRKKTLVCTNRRRLRKRKNSKKAPLYFGKAEKKGANVFTTADFYHRLFIEKALNFLRKALFLFIILFVCNAVKFAQLILLRF